MGEERKLVTVLFADIVDSTALGAARDPEVVRATLRDTFAEMREVLTAYGGTVEKFIGDAVMAVFGVPTVHDDDADRGVRAAFALREGVGRVAERRRIPLQVRIGVNSGEAVSGSGEGQDFLVTGGAVNAGARLQQAATPGEVLVGALTHRLTRAGVEYGEPRPIAAKGLGELAAWPALALRTALPEQHRGIEGLRAPLIGRDEELRMLLEAFERTRAEARASLVTVFGGAGVGKSRLAEEFLTRLEGALVRAGRCLPYGEGITLFPVQQILWQDTGIARTDNRDTAVASLERAVTEVFGASEDAPSVTARLAVLAGFARADMALPGVAEEEIADELAWGLRRYLEQRARMTPLVLVFEDVHWADPAFLDLIERLAEAAKAPLFLLCLARPEFLETRPGWGGGKVNAVTIVLEPLTPEETRRLVGELLALDALPEERRREVIDRAEGNPLYVEEFVRLLIETRQIERREGRWVATSAGTLDVPATLQGLIAARIDRASAEVKRLLQRGAIVGRFFATTAVAALADGEMPSAAGLRDAVRHDLLVDADERGFAGGRMYRFKHVLIREVAYASVPKSERARLHDRYTRWLEEVLGDRVEEIVEIVAHHAEQAYLLARELGSGDAAALARRAFERLTAAAHRARLRMDVRAALALYRRALAAADACEANPRERAELGAYGAQAWNRVEATTEAVDALEASLDELRALDATDLVFELTQWRPFSHPEEAKRRASHEELKAIAAKTRDPGQSAWVLYAESAFVTDVAERRRILEAALSYARGNQLLDRVRGFLHLLFFIALEHGRFSDARALMDACAREVGPTPTRRDREEQLAREGHLAQALRDFDSAVRIVERDLEVERDFGELRRIAVTLGWLAEVILEMGGDVTGALPLVEERLALIAAKFTPWQRPHAHAQHARLLLALGRREDARRAADAAIASMMPDRPNGYALMTRALLHSTDGERAVADRLVAQATAEVERWGNLSPQFHFDLALYLLDSGRPVEARRVLEAFRARLSDPLADRLRAYTDELLARSAASTTA